MVAQFEKEHPDIKVDTLRIGTYYPEKLQAMMVGNVAPDVIMVQLSQYFEWAARGALLDLTDELTELSKQGEYMPWSAAPSCGRTAASRCRSMSGLRLVREHGRPRRRRLEGAGGRPDLGVAGGGRAQAFPARRQSEFADRLRLRFPAHRPVDPVGFGTKVFDDDGHPTRVTVKTPEMHAAFTYIRKMNDSAASCR